jgi:hypothetical protein
MENMNRENKALVSIVLVAVIVSLMIWGSSGSSHDPNYPSDSTSQTTPIVASWPGAGQAVPYFTPTPVQQASSVATQ